MQTFTRKTKPSPKLDKLMIRNTDSYSDSIKHDFELKKDNLYLHLKTF